MLSKKGTLSIRCHLQYGCKITPEFSCETLQYGCSISFLFKYKISRGKLPLGAEEMVGWGQMSVQSRHRAYISGVPQWPGYFAYFNAMEFGLLKKTNKRNRVTHDLECAIQLRFNLSSDEPLSKAGEFCKYSREVSRLYMRANDTCGTN